MKKILILSLCLFLIAGCSSKEREDSRLDGICGTIDQNVYVNAYFDIVANFDDSWDVETREEIDARRAAQDSSESAYVALYAQKEWGIQSANVVIEDIDYNSTKETLIEKTKNEIKKDIKKMGLKEITQEIAEGDFLGERGSCIQTTGIYTTTKGKEMNVFFKQYAIEKNRYLAIVTFCSVNEDRTEEIAKNFYKLD